MEQDNQKDKVVSFTKQEREDWVVKFLQGEFTPSVVKRGELKSTTPTAKNGQAKGEVGFTVDKWDDGTVDAAGRLVVRNDGSMTSYIDADLDGKEEHAMQVRMKNWFGTSMHLDFDENNDKTIEASADAVGKPGKLRKLSADLDNDGKADLSIDLKYQKSRRPEPKSASVDLDGDGRSDTKFDISRSNRELSIKIDRNADGTVDDTVHLKAPAKTAEREQVSQNFKSSKVALEDFEYERRNLRIRQNLSEDDLNELAKSENANVRMLSEYLLANFDNVKDMSSAGGKDTINIADVRLLTDLQEANERYSKLAASGGSDLQEQLEAAQRKAVTDSEYTYKGRITRAIGRGLGWLLVLGSDPSQDRHHDRQRSAENAQSLIDTLGRGGQALSYPFVARSLGRHYEEKARPAIEALGLNELPPVQIADGGSARR